MLRSQPKTIMNIGYAIAFDALAGLTVLTLGLVARGLISGNARPLQGGVQNVAESLAAAGHLVGSFLVVAAALAGCVTGQDVVADIAWTALFGGTGVVLLALLGRVGTDLILGARLRAEIARGNAASGLAAAAHEVATGILIGSCLYGRDLGGFGISLAFFALAQVTLHLFVIAFRALTVYGDREEILAENLAAALSYAGVTLGLGIIIGHAADGTFVGVEASLRAYAASIAGSVALYPVRQIVVGAILLGGGLRLRGGRLDDGIAREKSTSLGVLEAAAYLATALLWTRLA